MSLPEFSTKYPVTVTMATLAVILLGWISLGQLGIDLLPNLQIPVITTDLRAPGKSPREMEERYTRHLERIVSTVRGVKRVYSITRSGQSVVVAECSWDADMDFVLLDIQKGVGGIASNEDVETIDVNREDPQALPVMRVAVSSRQNLELDELLGTVEMVVKPKLESLDGVASAEVEGGTEKEVRVILDTYLLEAFGVDMNRIVTRIKSAESDVSGGTLKDGQQSYLVKALGRLKNLSDVQALIVDERRGKEESGQQVEGQTRVPVTVDDVARVELDYKKQETIVRLNGKECLGLGIYKEAGENTVIVVHTVMDALKNLSQDLPDLQFTVVENQAQFVEQAVSEVEESAIHGALLAIGILLIVLRNWTVTLVIGLAIPISILATFTLMYFQGLTLNVMTLGGLALGAGMLVDNAIVVIENIYRHLEDGADAREASARGAREVGVAIMASTLTTVSVFLPIIYLHGLVGELFKEQAWTVTFSLISSLFVSMTTVPMLTSRIFRNKTQENRRVRSARYGLFLEGSLNRKGMVLLVILGTLGYTVYMARTIQTEFIPREDQGIFQIDIALKEGTRLEVTDRVAQQVGQIVQKLGGNDVKNVYMRIGLDQSRISGIGEQTGSYSAKLTVSLNKKERRSTSQLVEVVNGPLQKIPELQVKYRLHETVLEGIMGSKSAPIQLEIIGENLEILGNLTEKLKSRIESLASVYNVRTSFQGGQPEVDLVMQEDVASAFGLTTQEISRILEQRLSGEIAGELSKNQRTRTIRVGFDDMDLQELKTIRVQGPDGSHLSLGDVADLKIVEGPREILREGQRRVGRITGYLAQGVSLSEAILEVEQEIRAMIVPNGYRIEIGGEERERSESFSSLKFALLLSVILVYMVMASLFESILHPFTVMLTVPLSGIGVVVAFWVCGEVLSVMAFIGIIMLGGIAVNDAIVLVDRINQLRLSGKSVRDAVLQGGQDRLRPILMTSGTTILALLPMSLGIGEGAGLRAPMAIAVIGGLVTSTLMTLIVIPVVYEAFDLLRKRENP